MGESVNFHDKDYASKLLRISAAQACSGLGFKSVSSQAFDVLLDLYKTVIQDTARQLKIRTDHFGRVEPILDDLGLVLEAKSVSLPDIKDFMVQYKPPPFPFKVPDFPVSKPKPLYTPKPSEAELAERDDAIPPYFPSIHPPFKAGKVGFRSGTVEAPGRIRNRRGHSTAGPARTSVAECGDMLEWDAFSAGLVRDVTPPPPVIRIKMPEPPTVPPPPPFLPSIPTPKKEQPTPKKEPPTPKKEPPTPKKETPAPPTVQKLRINLEELSPPSSATFAPSPPPFSSLGALSQSQSSDSVPSASEGRLSGLPPSAPAPKKTSFIPRGRPPKKKPQGRLSAKAKQPKVSGKKGSMAFLFSAGVPSAPNIPPAPPSRPPSALAEKEEVVVAEKAPPMKLSVPALKLNLSPRAEDKAPKSAKAALPGIFGSKSKPKPVNPSVAAAEQKKKSALKHGSQLKIKLKMSPASASTSKEKSERHRAKMPKKSKKLKRKRRLSEAAKLPATESSSMESPQREPEAEPPAKFPKLTLRIKNLPIPEEPIREREITPEPLPTISNLAEEEVETKKVTPLRISLGGAIKMKLKEEVKEERGISPISTASSPPVTPGGGSSPLPRTPSPRSETPASPLPPTPSIPASPPHIPHTSISASTFVPKLVIQHDSPKPRPRPSPTVKKKTTKKLPKIKLNPLISPTPSVVSSESSIGGVQDLWVCPVCGVAYSPDSDMIACDGCVDERWFHWSCVGLIQAPAENTNWYCSDCILGSKKGGGLKNRRKSSSSSKGKKTKKKT